MVLSLQLYRIKWWDDYGGLSLRDLEGSVHGLTTISLEGPRKIMKNVSIINDLAKFQPSSENQKM
jgi:hypothetical protein